jgi:hypothetical protein
VFVQFNLAAARSLPEISYNKLLVDVTLLQGRVGIPKHVRSKYA